MAIGQVDRASPLPLYHQAKRGVLKLIEDDGLSPGDQLPTEAALETALGVSRTTIRQGLSELVHEGHVTRVQGRGTFVAAPVISGRASLSSFSRTVSEQGYEPSRRILDADIDPNGPTDILKRFGVSSGSVVWLRRLLLADDLPVGVAETWLLTERVTQADRLLDLDLLTRRSLYDILLSPPFGVDLCRATEAIVPATADERVAALLAIEVGDPVLDVDRLTRDSSGACVEITQILFSGKRFVYHLDLHVERKDAGR